jgi:hypothetical protein
MNQELFSKLVKAETYLLESQYRPHVYRARMLFEEGKDTECKIVLESLPTAKQLLDALVEKLQGKSVHKTLVKIATNECKSKFELLKGLFSLSTHVIIEAELGHREYLMLLPQLYSKIGEVIGSDE